MQITDNRLTYWVNMWLKVSIIYVQKENFFSFLSAHSRNDCPILIKSRIIIWKPTLSKRLFLRLCVFNQRRSPISSNIIRHDADIFRTLSNHNFCSCHLQSFLIIWRRIYFIFYLYWLVISNVTPFIFLNAESFAHRRGNAHCCLDAIIFIFKWSLVWILDNLPVRNVFTLHIFSISEILFFAE